MKKLIMVCFISTLLSVPIFGFGTGGATTKTTSASQAPHSVDELVGELIVRDLTPAETAFVAWVSMYDAEQAENLSIGFRTGLLQLGEFPKKIDITPYEGLLKSLPVSVNERGQSLAFREGMALAIELGVWHPDPSWRYRANSTDFNKVWGDLQAATAPKKLVVPDVRRLVGVIQELALRLSKAPANGHPSRDGLDGRPGRDGRDGRDGLHGISPDLCPLIELLQLLRCEEEKVCPKSRYEFGWTKDVPQAWATTVHKEGLWGRFVRAVKPFLGIVEAVAGRPKFEVSNVQTGGGANIGDVSATGGTGGTGGSVGDINVSAEAAASAAADAAAVSN